MITRKVITQFACCVYPCSMAEAAALTSELDALRGKKSPGTAVNLFSPYLVFSIMIHCFIIQIWTQTRVQTQATFTRRT